MADVATCAKEGGCAEDAVQQAAAAVGDAAAAAVGDGAAAAAGDAESEGWGGGFISFIMFILLCTFMVFKLVHLLMDEKKRFAKILATQDEEEKREHDCTKNPKKLIKSKSDYKEEPEAMPPFAPSLQHEEDLTPKLGPYLRYRFAYWYAWTDNSAFIVLLLLSTLLIAMGAFFKVFFVGDSPQSAVWTSWIWLCTPDGGAGEESAIGRGLGAIMSFGGIVVFALFVSMISDAFQTELQELRSGKWPVVESGHHVVIGWNSETLTVIEELAKGMAHKGGGLIVLLSELDKTEAEGIIQDAELDFEGTKVVVRSGRADEPHDLKKAAAHAADTVVVLQDHEGGKREEKDAKIMRILLCLRGLGWPLGGRLVVQASLVRNQHLLERLSRADQGRGTVMLVDDFIGQLMVQCARQAGLAGILNMLFGFDGDEFYVRSVPDLVGRSFEEILFLFPESTPIGVVSPDGKATLLPDPQYKIQTGDKIAMVSEDGAMEHSRTATVREFNIANWRKSLPPGMISGDKQAHRKVEMDGGKTEFVVVIGWHDVCGVMMVELDKSSGPGTKVLVYSPIDKEEREQFLEKAQIRRRHAFKNIEVTHVQGSLNARFQLEELPLKEATKLFFIADATHECAREVDGQTIAAMLQVRDILEDENGVVPDIPMIPQIMRRETEDLCILAGLSDNVDSSRLGARTIAGVGLCQDLKGIFEELLSETGCSVTLRELKDFCGPGRAPTELSFYEAMAFAYESGEICIGWSLHPMSSLKLPKDMWDMNPKDKSARRRWENHDKLVVLAPSVSRLNSGRRASQQIGTPFGETPTPRSGLSGLFGMTSKG